MVKFLNGPAAGQVLMLKRAPDLLRVTCARYQDAQKAPKFDALDQLGDEPRPEETLYAYRRTEAACTVHVRLGGKAKHASGFYAHANYELCTMQPTDEQMRDTEQWRTWCRTHHKQ